MNDTKINILLVVVLYKTNLIESPTYNSILKSLKKGGYKADMVVYNNSPQYGVPNISSVPQLDITYIEDASNSGVSKAYNVAAKIAEEKGKKWLLLLDQDTHFPENTIATYLNAQALYPQHKLFAPIVKAGPSRIVSPCKFRFMRGAALTSINPGIHKLKGMSVINAGMCISLNAFKQNNGYNELIKLDFSDHDFVKRFVENISNEVIVIDLVINHNLSSEGTSSLTTESARFDYYLLGAKQVYSSPAERFILKVNTFGRVLKMSLKYKSLIFFMKLLRYNYHEK